MGLTERVAARLRGSGGDEQRFTLGDYQQMFNFDGLNYPYGLNTTYPGQRVQEISTNLPGYMAALAGCPPAFGAQMVRAQVLSQARFVFRKLGRSGTPRKLYGTPALLPLERPWKNATTGELLSRMEWYAGLAGNAYVYHNGAELHVLRPDWIRIAYGSQTDPGDPLWQTDSVVIGYLYRPNGWGPSNQTPAQFLTVGDVSHWSPIPDPESPGLGMSWLTPAIRDIQGDRAATEHKLKYFTNGATPNLVVKGVPGKNANEFNEYVDMMEASHKGIRNAYKSMYLVAGADASIIGANLRDIDYKAVQGAGETRISLLSRVPASLLGISEGLAGSALNAGNFSSARRSFADTWVYPTLQDISAALAPLVAVPGDSELWTDTGDIPLLREDGKDAADIQGVQATTIRTLSDGGFEPESVVKALQANDWGLLKHTGLPSVQVQTPTAPPAVPAAKE